MRLIFIFFYFLLQLADASQDAVQETRAKMLDFLNESTFYKAERILSRLPVDGRLIV